VVLAVSLVLLVLAPAFQAPAPTPAAKTSPSPAARTSPSPAPDYEIGEQDILKIGVDGLDDLTQVVIVQPDGTFQFPLIGRVKASGLTPKQLEKKMALLLARGFVRNPQVTVVVQEYRSKTVLVLGEVARPGSYPLSGTQTLMDVLARAAP
jgi:polysaccharide biosynthesis/export protein